MSMDRIHDVNGLMQFAAQPVIGTTGTASTVASNQYPGGYQFGNGFGIVAGSNSTNGGALVAIPIPRAMATTDFQSFATTGTITHDGAPVVLLSISTTGISLNLQAAISHGQCLTIACVGTTGSIATGLTTTGFGGTTTAACRAVDVAQTINSSGAVFQAFAQLGGTATTNLPFVWHRIC